MTVRPAAPAGRRRPFRRRHARIRSTVWFDPGRSVRMWVGSPSAGKPDIQPDREPLRPLWHGGSPICLVSRSLVSSLRAGVSRVEASDLRAKISVVTTAPPAPLLLVQGDEELLAARAISAAVAAARADEPGADVREYEAGAL